MSLLPKDLISRVEEIWNYLPPAEYALTISWAIYTLGKVMRRLDTIKVNLGLEDEIGALTLLLDESEEPPVIQLGGLQRGSLFSPNSSPGIAPRRRFSRKDQRSPFRRAV